MLRTPLIIKCITYKSSYIKTPLTNSVPNNLCIQCKYYLHPSEIWKIEITDLKLGFCKKSGMVHLVDGSITYDYACTYREYNCKGSLFEVQEAIIDVENSNI